MSRMAQSPQISAFTILAICAGASMGALARWALSIWLNNHGSVPLGTLAANWIGAYLVGAALGVFEQWPDLAPIWRLMLVTGFLGALTTFSTFSSEVITQLLDGRFLQAGVTAALHLFGSLLLTAAGLWSVRWLCAN